MIGARLGPYESPDGDRFLVQLRAAESEPPITVVLNWQNALRR